MSDITIIGSNVPSTSTKVPLAFHVGEDVTVQVTISPVVDITGWTLVMTARLTLGVLPLAFQKSTGGFGIVITSGPLGVFNITVASADTSALAAVEYFYDIQRTDVGFRHVLVEGMLTLAAMVNPAP